MIAVDTNILIYAHRTESPWHREALNCVTQLAEGSIPWTIPWSCIHEFFGTVTHPKVFKPPTPVEIAIEQLNAWQESPSFSPIGEGDSYWPVLRKLIVEGKVRGPRVHDARIAAVCLQHQVQELWTVDRDFSQFPSVPRRNPLISKTPGP